MEVSEQKKSIPVALRYACAVLLIMAVGDWPYGYYEFLRIVSFITFAWLSWCSWENKSQIWFVIYALLAVLFNPLFKISLDKSEWLPIDVLAAAILVVAHAYTVWKQRKSAQEQKPSEIDSSLRGMGGWLTFLVLVLMVLAPLSTFGQISISVQDTEKLYPHIVGLSKWEMMKSTMWLFSVFQAITLFFAGLLLLKTRLKSSVHRVIVMMWIGGPIINIIGVMVLSYQSVQSFALLSDPKSIGNLAASIIGILLWTAYLKMSRRVKNTYVET